MFNLDPLANPEPLIRRVYAYVAYRIEHDLGPAHGRCTVSGDGAGDDVATCATPSKPASPSRTASRTSSRSDATSSASSGRPSTNATMSWTLGAQEATR